MTPQQALQILAQTAALALVNLKTHQAAQQAVEVLNALINPIDKAKKTEKKQDTAAVKV